MTTNTSQLPDDIEALKALLIERDSKITEQAQEMADLRHNVEIYRRMAFGPSSEKRPGAGNGDAASGQGHLFAAALVAEAERVAMDSGVEGSIETQAPSAPKSKSGRRKRFPDHLPRVSTRYERDGWGSGASDRPGLATAARQVSGAW